MLQSPHISLCTHTVHRDSPPRRSLALLSESPLVSRLAAGGGRGRVSAVITAVSCHMARVHVYVHVRACSTRPESRRRVANKERPARGAPREFTRHPKCQKKCAVKKYLLRIWRDCACLHVLPCDPCTRCVRRTVVCAAHSATHHLTRASTSCAASALRLGARPPA